MVRSVFTQAAHTSAGREASQPKLCYPGCGSRSLSCLLTSGKNLNPAAVLCLLLLLLLLPSSAYSLHKSTPADLGDNDYISPA